MVLRSLLVSVSGMGFRALYSKGHLQNFLFEGELGFCYWCRYMMLQRQICRAKKVVCSHSGVNLFTLLQYNGARGSRQSH